MIMLPSVEDKKTFKIKIHYSTSPNLVCKKVDETNMNGGLCWFEPPTSVGKYPFVFTQGQAIEARSYIPCQDTPSVRTTYYAKVTTHKKFAIVMSGISSKADKILGEKRTSIWEQKIPIQSYLITFTVGRLSSKQIGKFCNLFFNLTLYYNHNTLTLNHNCSTTTQQNFNSQRKVQTIKLFPIRQKIICMGRTIQNSCCSSCI